MPFTIFHSLDPKNGAGGRERKVRLRITESRIAEITMPRRVSGPFRTRSPRRDIEVVEVFAEGLAIGGEVDRRGFVVLPVARFRRAFAAGAERGTARESRAPRQKSLVFRQFIPSPSIRCTQ